MFILHEILHCELENISIKITASHEIKETLYFCLRVLTKKNTLDCNIQM